MLVTNSKAKEEIFRSDFLLSDLQDFWEGYKNAMNKEDYLKNYATEERKKPSIIYQIEAAIVSVLNWDALRYGGGAGGFNSLSEWCLCLFLPPPAPPPYLSASQFKTDTMAASIW